MLASMGAFVRAVALLLRLLSCLTLCALACVLVFALAFVLALHLLSFCFYACISSTFTPAFMLHLLASLREETGLPCHKDLLCGRKCSVL